MMLLIVQPMAIQWRRPDIHRTLGRASLFLMPAVVVGFIGLAHSGLQGKTGFEFATQAYFDYIRVVLVVIFVGAFIIGGIPPAFDFHTWGVVWTVWKSIVGAFAQLPLT